MTRRVKLLIIFLLLAALTSVGLMLSGVFYSTFTPNCTGVAATDTAAFQSIITFLNGRTGTIKVPWTTTRCVVNNLTIPSNVTLDFASNSTGIQIVNGQTLTLGSLSAPSGQIFYNALAGQGTVSFTGPIPANPLWWAPNTTPGATDMTAAAQAAINATGGRGRVYFPTGSYLITNTLTTPAYSNPIFSLVELTGDGPFLSNLVNKASANKPTLLLAQGLVRMNGLGFWGDDLFPNDAVKISGTGRIYIQNCLAYAKGNGFFLEQAQSVWIQSCFGGVSSGSALPPAGVTTPIASFGATASFVYLNIPNSGYVNHLVIEDNMNELYTYPVYGNQAGTGSILSATIARNQFEGSANGITLSTVLDSLDIRENYLSEGGTGYAIDLDNCRYGTIGPNYIHIGGYDQKISTIKLNNCFGLTLFGEITRLYLTGTTRGLTASGCNIDRLQDESSDHLFGMRDCLIGSISVPQGALNSISGHARWFSDSTSFTAYPTVRLGDQIQKVTPTAGTSPGWVATTASSAGALVAAGGNTGPNPVVLGDYAAPTAYDFRITMLSGGATATATYKVEWKTAGGGSYADLENPITTSELAHAVMRSTGSGPVISFAVRWPLSQTYVIGDQWTLTAVGAPVWKGVAPVAA